MNGSLRGKKIPWVESSYADDYASPFLSVAFENQMGGKKLQRLPCRSLGYSSACATRRQGEVLLPLREFDIHAPLELVQ